MLFQILDDNACLQDVTNCCSDYALAVYLNILQKVILIIQIIVPIILIIMCAIGLYRLISNPEDQGNKLKKSLLNKFIAAVVVFLIPVLFNTIISLFPMPSKFELFKCWEYADEVIAEANRESS